MPSDSARKFHSNLERSVVYKNAAVRKGTAYDEKQCYLHAWLAYLVAAWDAYLHDVTNEFYSRTSRSSDVAYLSMHAIANRQAEQASKRFNTPNWEKSREQLVNCTGYDPYADWVWKRAKMKAIDAQQYLNDILRVRHAFAHGATMPSLQWTRSSTGRPRLTVAAVERIARFLTNLVSQTDRGLQHHIASALGPTYGWP